MDYLEFEAVKKFKNF